MTRQHKLFEGISSIAGSFLLGLEPDWAALQWGHFLCMFLREAQRVLLLVILAAWHGQQVCGVDPCRLLECLL
jgi:hypothetical protein